MNIQSFVFLDSETTGIPAFEFNKTKIIELCFISVQSEHIRLGVYPRVQNKLNLCFNPLKRIQPQAEDITGLHNEDLQKESEFNEESLNLINIFLSRLQKPICFVAHNGYRFDYPILRNHIEILGKAFLEDILCIDSLLAFRNLLKESKTEISTLNIIEKPVENNLLETNVCQAGFSNHIEINETCKELTDEWDELLYNEVLKIENKISETESSAENLQQIRNETTPPIKKKLHVPGAPQRKKKQISLISDGCENSKVRKRLNFNEKKSVNFKLSDIYERLLQKSPVNAHQAEGDVQMLIECAVKVGSTFVDYANQNAILFNTIPKMEVGKKIGL